MQPLTPGDWTARHRHVHAGPHDDELDGLGWELDGPEAPTGRGQFARAADAYALAAAPKLLMALQDLLDFAESNERDYSAPHEYQAVEESVIKAAHDAIRKAKGEA